MSTDDATSPAPSGKPEEIDRLFAQYVDRLNRGEILDATVIRKRHPEHADELIGALEDFEAFGDASTGTERLEDTGGPRLFGDYEIVRELGRGGMGVVYEALERTLDRRVALKVLSAGLLVDSTSVLRFRREARIAGRLQHASIVSVFATGVEGDTPYIAMEFVEGETLDRILERKRPGSKATTPPPLTVDTGGAVATVATPVGDADAETVATPDAPTPHPPADSIREDSWSPIPATTEDMDLSYCIHMSQIFARVARALAHAHSQGITHRDLKPSNLILDRRGELRVLDFGLAVLEGQEHLTNTGEIVGTPRYMSPEQAQARTVEIDHRTDIYSLGATLFEVLTLTPPFVGRTAQDTLSRIIHDEVRAIRKINPRVPRDLETIVLKCLRKEPAARYATAEELAGDLESFSRGDPISARPQTMLETWSRRARRHRGKILASLLFAVVATLGIWFAVQSRKHESEKDLVERQRVLASYDRNVLDAVVAMERSGALAYNAAFFAFEGVGYDIWGMSAGFEPYDEQRLKNNEDLATARAALAAATRAVPTRPEAWYHLARLRLAVFELDDARDALDRAIALDFAPALSLKANEFRGEEDIAAVEEATARFAKTWGADWLHAQSALSDSRWSKAAETFDGLVELQRGAKELFLGARVAANFSAGRAYLGKKDFPRAIARFRTASALETGAVEPRLFLGAAHLEAGDTAEADRVFEEIHARSPTPAVVQWIVMLYVARHGEWNRGLYWSERFEDEYSKLLWQMTCLPRIGRPAEASRLAKRLTEIHPELPLTHFIASQAHLNAGEFEASASSAKEAIRLQPESSSGYSLLSAAQFQLGKNIEAFMTLLKAVEVEPDAAAPHFYLGFAYQAQNRLEKAAEHFELAIKNQGARKSGFFQLDSAYHRLGLCRSRLGKHAQAVEPLRQAVELASEGREPHWLWIRDLARAEIASGEVNAGIIEFERVLDAVEDSPHRFETTHAEYLEVVRSVAPNFPTYGSIDAILALAENSSPEARSKLFDGFRTAASGPNVAGRTAFFRGRLLEARGEHADAREQFANAMAHDRERFEPVLALAKSHITRGKPEAASDLLETFLSKSPQARASVSRLYVALQLTGSSAEAAFSEPHRARIAKWRNDDDRRASSYLDLVSQHFRILEHERTIRLNCGGGDHQDPIDKRWLGDRFYSGGDLFQGGQREFSGPIASTRSPRIYRTERWFRAHDGRCGGYKIPLRRGQYTVTLHFAEIRHEEPGQRTFDVKLEGRRVIERFAPAAGGFATAKSFRLDVEVDDGFLDLDFVPLAGNPKISGIEVTQTQPASKPR